MRDLFITDCGRSGKIMLDTSLRRPFLGEIKREVYFSIAWKEQTFVPLMDWPIPIKYRRNVLNNAAD
jgi:hypothetical protein